MKYAILIQSIAIILLIAVIATFPKPGMAPGDKIVFTNILKANVAQGKEIIELEELNKQCNAQIASLK